MKKENKKIKLTVVTGLHIGMGNDAVQIGGVDSEVIKDPINKLPYIPGSSIKGKIRCLLETEGSPTGSGYGEKDLNINNIFGNKETKSESKSPTRLLFRDLKLSEVSLKLYKDGEINNESKTEISIDRKTGTASKAGPRTIERVPPTVEFEGEVLVRYNDENDLILSVKILEEGIKLLNNDYLGGSGSRGYGAVKVQLI